MAFYSSLADSHMDNFSHNNMVPFFGSGLRQNMDVNMNQTLLEKYTGYDDSTRIDKTEQPNFADIKQNSFIHENSRGYLTEFERMEVPVLQNNTLPVESIKVGPGTKFTDPVNASGGFQQNDFRDIQYYKDINNLRVKTKPKETYEGRFIDGKKELKRGLQAKLEKNRVNTFHENSDDYLLPNTGPEVKERQRPSINIKKTNRKTTQEVKGNSYAPILGKTIQGAVRNSSKPCLKQFGNRNAQNTSQGLGDSNDYGRTNILVYNNERDITTTRTYEGNLTSYIKSMVAPIMDVIKPTNKEFLIQNAREFGQFQSTIPSKQTIYNPNDPMRTTIKETTVHDTRTGNLKGNEKITTYNPNDVTRTTIKETLIHDTRTGNIKLDPKSIVYDPNEIAKVTLRETLDNIDNNVNLRGHKKHTIYNPEEARTTIRETTIDDNSYGIAGQDKGGGYATNKHDAKPTNKQFMENNKYIGHPENQNADGYKNANFNAKITNKEVTSNHEHFGHASHGENEAMMSYENIYNAVVNQTREQLFQTHTPTQTGTKVTNGPESLNLTQLPIPELQKGMNYNISKIYNEIPSKSRINLTQTNFDNVNPQRLDPSLLKPFHDNPYTQSLTNAV